MNQILIISLKFLILLTLFNTFTEPTHRAGHTVSWTLLLLISGCADIYDWYGKFENICQKINVLSHERFDKAVALIKAFFYFVSVH